MTGPGSAVPVRQVAFDRLGPVVHQEVGPAGRALRWIDEGEPRWPVLLFLGGAGTSVRAFGLLEFARSLREELRIRVVSVERNGLGQTLFHPDCGPAAYAADVWWLLDRLDVSDVAVVAISGGGPYAAHVMATRPSAVRSVHLACAWAEALPGSRLELDADDVARDPVSWWRFPRGSSVHRVPGLVDAAVDEATRAVFARGSNAAHDGLGQAFRIYSQEPLPDLSKVAAPAFLYWGEHDDVVPAAQRQRWERALPDVRTTRLYAGERHDV